MTAGREDAGSSGAQARGRFADRYESVLVPVIFRPWAREMIRRIAPRAGERVLDLACGTGVVTRELAGLGPDAPALTGADHSAEMLDVARRRAEADGVVADWVVADAAALPFGDDSFDAAICQQAFQFFPDRPAALAELRRVLAPGGRVAFCVQREIEVNPLLAAQAATLDRNAGPEAGAAVRAICGLPDGDEIRALFEAAGFRDVVVESVTLWLEHPDGRAFAEGAMGGMHTGDKLAGMQSEGLRKTVDDFLEGLGDCLDGRALRFPHVSNVVTGHA